VEQLQHDVVWTVLRQALEYLERAGGRATAFVSTTQARQAEYDLSERLQWLVDHGHEVAMHTHFRSSLQPSEVVGVVQTPTDADVAACLAADYGYLVDHGHVPRGFCAGSWSIFPAAGAWLRRHDFRYDCSFRTYALGYEHPPAAAGDSHVATSHVNGLVQIPTTATLRTMISNAATRRYPFLPYEGGKYTLFYAHDWDLLVRRRALAWRLLAWRLQGSRFVTVSELASEIGRPAD
jgi:peptidoglycan/xylan/chitin deacetylase (PgdA/CDA1 family)